jgi:hypothetical protein
MNKLIEVLIAGFLFVIIVFFLIPMLPASFSGFVLTTVVFIAIIYLLLLAVDYKFPWNK